MLILHDLKKFLDILSSCSIYNYMIQKEKNNFVGITIQVLVL